MKKSIQILFVAASTLFIGGCYIDKKGNICSLTMPRAYCDKEVYDQLTKPGRMVDRWNMNGVTVQGRLHDWLECGGSQDGDYWLGPLPDGQDGTSDQGRAAAKVKVHGIARCMMKKHYVYTGHCASIMEGSFPPCRARAGLPWE